MPESPENPNHLCLLCAKAKPANDRRDLRIRGQYLSTHLRDGVEYNFTICDDCIQSRMVSGLLHTNDEYTCSRCHCSTISEESDSTRLGISFYAYLLDGCELVSFCEGCLVALFDEAEPEARPTMLDSMDHEPLPWTKYNWNGSEKSMDAVVGAPEMKIEPIALKIVIKPADAGVKEKTMKGESTKADTVSDPKLSDPPMSAMRFMAKRLGVKLPDDVASVGHATNVIEDALGAKIQQAMADTGFGVAHDIVRALGIDLDDRQGEPLGSYRHRVQAAIEGKIGQARLEGRDDGVNEVLAALEDQIQDSERQRKMLVEQLDRVNAHRITLQQVHADARKMRRGGAS